MPASTRALTVPRLSTSSLETGSVSVCVWIHTLLSFHLSLKTCIHTCIHAYVLMRDERKKKEASKVRQTTK